MKNNEDNKIESPKELIIIIRKIDNSYKVFYEGIQVDGLVVHPINDFHFHIKNRNLDIAMITRIDAEKFRFITGVQRFLAYMESDMKWHFCWYLH